MPCTVIAGAFWGDEGKGKIISYLALKDKLDVCVRTGSVNAAHTVWLQGKRYALHMVPAAFVYENCRLLIGAGANVHVAKFLEEVEATNVKNRIGLDHQASIIEDKRTSKRAGHNRMGRRTSNRRTNSKNSKNRKGHSGTAAIPNRCSN